MKVALFPGSFDPFTKAHEEIVLQALTIFDVVVVGVGCNILKKGFLSVDSRIELIKRVFEGVNEVKVMSYSSLTVDFCAVNGIKHIVRGVRNFADFEAERDIADINSMINSEITTIYLTTSKATSSISSSAVREVVKFGGNPAKLLPNNITADYFETLLSE